MEKLKRVSPHSLEGDNGWQMKDAYQECIKVLEEYEKKITLDWQTNITSELTMKLKQPLLVWTKTQIPELLQVYIQFEVLNLFYSNSYFWK